MREIKFRAWDGSKMTYDIMVGKFGVFYVNPDNNGLDERDTSSLSTFSTKFEDGVKVMQYTGLKDKNGKEIYEGDILNAYDDSAKDDLWHFDFEHIGEIVYNGNHFALKIIEEKEPVHLQHWPNAENFEVIGNIYENPELLNQNQ